MDWTSSKTPNFLFFLTLHIRVRDICTRTKKKTEEVMPLAVHTTALFSVTISSSSLLAPSFYNTSAQHWLHCSQLGQPHRPLPWQNATPKQADVVCGEALKRKWRTAHFLVWCFIPLAVAVVWGSFKVTVRGQIRAVQAIATYDNSFVSVQLKFNSDEGLWHLGVIT